MKKPILFIVFNREDVALQVFSKIREYKPNQLFISSDGARAGRTNEAEIVKKIREKLLSLVDWNCDVKTKFNDSNMGCGKAVSTAISWFFSNVESGIILEDDCLPSLSFFEYIEESLDRYRDDKRIWSVGGYCPPEMKTLPENGYEFTRFVHVWGWGTWRNRWSHYDFNLYEYQKNNNVLKNADYFHSIILNKEREFLFKRIIDQKLDTWDYQWEFCVRVNGGLSLRPNVNLVKNIGFGEGATHTSAVDLNIVNNNYRNISKIEHVANVRYSKLRDVKYELVLIKMRVSQLIKKIFGI